MAADLKGNWYASRAGDGQNRSHIPAMPLWTGILRISQLVGFPQALSWQAICIQC